VTALKRTGSQELRADQVRMASGAGARAAARRVLSQAGLPLGVSGVFLGLWLVVSLVVLSPDRRFLLPTPEQVVRVGLLDHRNLVEVLEGLWSTTLVALTGLAIAAIVGITLAVVMSQASWIERTFYPYAVALQTIPILALVPLIGFWFGFDFPSRVLVCVLISIFPIIANTLFGIRSVDRSLHDLFTLYGAGRRVRLLKLQLPGALPAILTGLRISGGLAVIGAIVGDFFFRGGSPGLGRLIDLYRSRLQTEQLMTAVLFSSLLGLAVFLVFGWLIRRTVGAWHESGSPN
jgi:NitT/TauT family transport system permease protein